MAWVTQTIVRTRYVKEIFFYKWWAAYPRPIILTVVFTFPKGSAHVSSWTSNFQHPLPICLLADKIWDHQHAHAHAVCNPNLTLHCFICFSYCFICFPYCFIGFLQFLFRFVYSFGFQLILYQEMSIINRQIHKTLKNLKNLKTKTLNRKIHKTLLKNNKFQNPNKFKDLHQAHKKI